MNGIKKGEDKGGKKRISGTALTSLFNKFKRQGNSKTKSQSTTPQTVSPPEEGEEEPLPGLNIIRPHRLFVFEGRIIVFPNENDLSSNDEEQKKFEQIVFVFSDILMFCTSGKQVNSLVYISEIEFLPSSGTIDSVPWVRDLTDTLFQYVGIKETLTFKAKDEKEKKKWIENLDKTIEINLRKKFDDQEAPSKADPLYTPSQAYVYMKQQEEKEEEGEKEVKETTPKIEEEEVKFTVDDEDDLKVDLILENEVVTPQELSKIVSGAKVSEEVSEQVVSQEVVQEVVSEKVVQEVVSEQVEEMERNEQQKIIEDQARLKQQKEEEEKKKQEKLQEEKRQAELILQEKRKEEEKQTLLKLEEEKRKEEEKQDLLKLEEKKRQEELLKQEELKKQEKLEVEKKQQEELKKQEEEKIVEENEENEEEIEEIHTKSSEEEKRKRNGKKRKSQTVSDDDSVFEEKKVTTPPKKQYKEVEDVSQIEVLKKRLHSDNKYSNKLPTPPTKPTTPVSTDESKMIEEIEKKENISLKGTKPNDLEQLLNAYKDSQSSVTFVSEKAKINYEAQIIQIKRNLGKKKSRIGSVIDVRKFKCLYN
jgi:hypothetical protein